MDKDTFRFVIITGMSGAGKTNFMQKLEDMGYYCVDNLPPVLIVRFADLCWKSTSSTRHVAVVTDIRGGSFFDALPQALDELEKRGIPHEVVFLEASDEALVRRYMETRRQHPLAKNMRIQEGIEQERKILAGVRAQADMIIDTTSMQASDLKEYMQSRFSADSMDQEMQITVFSFGFKYGIPIDADMVIDVRFLPNPFYIAKYKHPPLHRQPRIEPLEKMSHTLPSMISFASCSTGFLWRSRCSMLTRVCFLFRYCPSFSVTKTERCMPPVQPMAMVNCVLPAASN